MNKNNIKFNFKAVNLCKSYNRAKVVSDFNVDIANGDVIGLIGDNGTGKSTILRMAALVNAPDTGDIFINDEKANLKIKYYRSKIGYIPQSSALIEEMSAIDNLQLFSTQDRETTRKKINELSDAFDMHDFLHKKVKHLSGGMARRVNISAGIINNPQMIVADEPFAGLDASQREKVIKYFSKLAKEGVGQIISSHYVENLKDWSKSIISI